MANMILKDVWPSLSRRSLLATLSALPLISSLLWRRSRSKSAHFLDSLVVAAEAIIGQPVELGHYREHFRWWSDRSSPARARYDKFLRTVRAQAQAQGLDLANANQLQLSSVLRILSNRASPEFVSVRTEILAVFARTDAWILLGYDGWPGTARGFRGLEAAPRTGGI